MIIYIRTATGWDKAENKDERKCDTCGHRLWIAPGDNVYCDNQHAA
ncbi:MAG TPA: hypothetical protein VLC46_00175 [Thermoanaerobaculia bacterium]|jgi:hypothetical protein|nr:hypothetical protein [Thermoanaerobaculia bacterium]